MSSTTLARPTHAPRVQPRAARDPQPPTRPAALHLLQAGIVLCALAFLPSAAPAADFFAFPKEAVLHATALAAALLLLRGAREARPGTEDLLLAAFAALGVVSSLAAAANGWLAARAIGMTLSGLAVFWSARSLARRGHARALTGAAVVAAGLLAASVLVEAYAGVALSTDGRAPGGTMGHRNSAAHVAVLALPVVVLHALAARHRLTRALTLAAAAAIPAVLVLSRSRGAWLAAMVLVAFAAAAFWTMRSRLGREIPRRRAAMVALALLAGGTLAAVLPNRLDWDSKSPQLDTLRGMADYQSGSGRGRVVQYGRTLAMIGDHALLGVGPGNWTIAYPRYAAANDPSYRPRDLVPTERLPQGDWIGLAAERGVPALLLLALAGCALAARAASRLRGVDAPGERSRALAALCVLAALVCLGTLDPILLQPFPTLFIALVLGALVPAGHGWRALEWTPGRKRLAVACVVLLFAPPLVVAARQLRAGTLVSRSADAGSLARAARAAPGDYRLRATLAVHWVRAGRCDLALPHIRAAGRLFPAAPAPRDLDRHCRQAPGGTRPLAAYDR